MAIPLHFRSRHLAATASTGLLCGCANSRRCTCGLAPEDRSGRAYDEQAFRYLLTAERRRADRAKRSFVLLLVSLRGDRHNERNDVAARVFESLSGALREVDFVGWYRDGRVVGAVLPLGDRQVGQASNAIAGRVTNAIQQQLPPHVVDRIRVKVLVLGPEMKR